MASRTCALTYNAVQEMFARQRNYIMSANLGWWIAILNKKNKKVVQKIAN
ncbi:MAG TPA: hypothetical protein VJ767_10005 [Nitrososphaeraceae archaeon]|nr:hypothetical protein [Nitrososphaeraceae archaeon]